MKQCTRCKETKELEEFYNDKRQTDGKSYYCKDCHRAYNKRIGEEPGFKEKRRQTSREWRERNPGYTGRRVRINKIALTLFHKPVYSRQEFNARVREVIQPYLDEVQSEQERQLLLSEIVEFSK